MTTVKLNELPTILDDLDFPVTHEALLEARGDVTVVLAEGEESLGDILAMSSEDEFASVDEVTNEVMSLLPRHAVGEPYQSEGEG